MSDAIFAATLPPLSFQGCAVPDATGVLHAGLPPLIGALRLAGSTAASFSATLPRLSLAGQASYQSRTPRPVAGSSRSTWHVARGQAHGIEDRSEATAHERFLLSNAWQRASPQVVGVESPRNPTLARSRLPTIVRYQDAARLKDQARIGYQDAVRRRTERQTSFDAALRSDGPRRTLRHQDGWRDRRLMLSSRYLEAQAHIGTWLTEWIQEARPLGVGWWLLWQNAMRPPPGRHVTVPQEPPRPTPCYVPSTHLVFAEPAAQNGHLLFSCEPLASPPDGSIFVPARRIYLVINDVTLTRWPDGVPVPVLSLSLALDTDSWAWGFDATLPAIAKPLLLPAAGEAPVELIASINGTAFHVLAENLSRERSFGEASLRLSGRGRSAALAAPYAPVLTFANTELRSARQLMGDALRFNGVPLDWTIDWALTDWNVPAGVFSRQGTWIEALTGIAQAAGGYLMPHPSEKVLHVRPRYPVGPWNWWDEVTPDVVLPADVVARESLRWIEKPAYNRVFVAGESTGVLGQVTRIGTAGNVLAPMIVDALITDVIAARQRGLAVLADTGRQIEVGLRLPILPEIGLITPGTFVAYQEGSVARLGLVRSTRIEASLPEVWQTLGVETHA